MNVPFSIQQGDITADPPLCRFLGERDSKDTLTLFGIAADR
ncbi:MAG: hypothetical protein ACK55E_11835 [Cyanobacteriota bacterium]